MIQKLIDYGLSPKEAEIYLALAKAGNATANQLAKTTNSNRTVAYNVLHSLLKKGIISFVLKNKKRYFSAASFESLMTAVKEKEILANELVADLQKLRPSAKQESHIEVFEGIEGVKKINKDLLHSGELRVLNATGLVKEVLKYSKGWLKEVAKNKVRVIANKGFDIWELTEHRNVQIKYANYPKTNYATTFIFKDTVIIQVIRDDPLVIKVKNKDLAEGYKMNFDMLWANLR